VPTQHGLLDLCRDLERPVRHPLFLRILWAEHGCGAIPLFPPRYGPTSFWLAGDLGCLPVRYAPLGVLSLCEPRPFQPRSLVLPTLALPATIFDEQQLRCFFEGHKGGVRIGLSDMWVRFL
jgi:hypothetical protein